MSTGNLEWQPQWRVPPGVCIDTAGALERLPYCLEWRQWLWHKPAVRLLAPFERFKGKRVMEIGARFGKMSCLLAAAGAQVTGVDVWAPSLPVAQEEARKWGVAHRTQFVIYDGEPANLPAGPFDIIFSKSVIVLTNRARVHELLQAFKQRLAPGGVGLFLENSNNWLFDKVRRYIVHRDEKRYAKQSWGFFPRDLDQFKDEFGSVKARRHLGLVWDLQVGGPF